MDKRDHLLELRDNQTITRKVLCAWCDCVCESEEATEAGAATAFYDTGWRFHHCEECQQEGIACPECVKECHV